MKPLKKIQVKAAAIINIITIAIALTVHLLTIMQIIPYTWINGGRSATLQAQQQVSLVSIFALLIMVLINLCAAKSKYKSKILAIGLAVLLWALFAASIFGFGQQLFGTLFEKLCMSILCLVNIVMYFRLAIEKRW